MKKNYSRSLLSIILEFGCWFVYWSFTSSCIPIKVGNICRTGRFILHLLRLLGDKQIQAVWFLQSGSILPENSSLIQKIL